MDAANGVRIVTVHSSKGLEARVVFLVDTVRTPKSEKILPVPGADVSHFSGAWLWTPRGDVSASRDMAAAALSRVRIAEYYRLLYVAMTRARDELYIYGFTQNKNANDVAWHSQLWRVLAKDNPDTDVIRITK